MGDIFWLFVNFSAQNNAVSESMILAFNQHKEYMLAKIVFFN